MKLHLTIKLQDETAPRDFYIYPGWNYLFGSFGCHVFKKGLDFTLRLTNGVYNGTGVGGIYYNYIQLNILDGRISTLKRAGQTAGRTSLWIGAPDEKHYFPPRSALIRRIATGRGGFLSSQPDSKRPYNLPFNSNGTLIIPKERAAWKIKAENNANLAALKLVSGAEGYIGDEFLNKAMGPFQPLGYDIPGAAGGQGIEPHPGWERSSFQRLLYHDLTMERHGTDCIDAVSGGPYLTPTMPNGGYEITRGWAKVTQLPRFCRPFGDMYDDRRLPVDFNSGTCLYKETLLKFLPHDGQHLIRAMRHAMAGWLLYEDEACKYSLSMMAVDSWYAWGRKVNLPQVIGREIGWVTYLMSIASGILPSSIENFYEGLIIKIVLNQMPNGQWQNVSFSMHYGFSPDPWINDGMATYYSVAQTIESAIIAQGLLPPSLLAVVDMSNKLYIDFVNAHGHIPKWVSVATNGVPEVTLLVGKGASETFNVWWVLGQLLYLTKNRKWLEAMFKIAPPGENTFYTTKETLLTALYKNPYVTHTSTAIAALESL